MRIRLETKSTAEVLELVAEQLEATMLEHDKLEAAATVARKEFDDSEAERKELSATNGESATSRPGKRRPSFYVEGIHLTLDITSNRHDPGEELELSVRLSKSY